MSYNSSFIQSIPVPYRGSITVHYPASQNGGSMIVDYYGTAYEDVEVDIFVDTSPFDSSVAHCNDSVNNLTASVGAMNTAQCMAIANNADIVSKSIINGFFHTVRTDLETQKAELVQTIEARLLLLRQQAATLREKQKTMSEDYARTSARYLKIFTDINNELSSRIHKVDQPVFDFVESVDTQNDRMLHTDMVQTVVLMNNESNSVEVKINTATVKRHAFDAMKLARDFLSSKMTSEMTMLQSCIDGTGNDSYMIPVCFMKTESENNYVETQSFIPNELVSRNPSLKDMISKKLENVEMNTNVLNDFEHIKSYIQSEIDNHIVSNDDHSLRVKSMINTMLNQQF